ncbi:lipopolysaccharide biosynthesis protein [Novosphingobium kaempferiae]|uniref:lipopolysaccharide biosynthesis protein n=1 Tax=Novosphingobium kaempferiae TaxID=2896849 RepID=UPI001E2CA6FE|nr:hypothetical protein [Novosphingobium kaempferiae]
MSRRRLSLGLGAYAFDKLAVALVQILTVPVLANAWGLTLYGTWAMVMTIPTFLVLGDFGIVNSAAARMIGAIARDDWQAATRTLHTAWAATLAIITAIALIIAAVLWWLPNGTVPTTGGFDEATSRLTILILLVYGLVTIIFRLNTAALRSAMLYSQSLIFGTGSYLVENLSVVAIAAWGFGPLAAAGSLLVLRLASLLAVYVAGGRLVPRLRPGVSATSRAELAELWGPALAASALGFGVAAYLQGSVMILGAIAGAAVVPAFTAVRTLSRLGVQMATMISLPVSQEFGNAMGKGEIYRGGRFFGLVFLPALILSGSAGLGLVLIGQPFIRIWTHGAIVADHTLLLFMAISSFAAMFWNPLSNLIMVMNRQRSFSYINLAISFVGLAVIYLGAREYGAAAAGVSFALVDMITLAAVVVFITRHWLKLPEFRAGVRSSMEEMRSPFRMLRSIRQSR